MDNNQTKVEYIYESPDGGNTIYRRRFGEKQRELYNNQSSETTSEESNNEPAVSTLTEEEINTKFDVLRKSLKSVRLRANWTQDYTMSHKVHEAVEMLEELERDVITASESAKLAIKNIEKDKL
jgi:hypothetical protein|tara:strand:+ start:209 stop:580 length:372 start_codon:yes stop_codon:yes gene_type:complete